MISKELLEALDSAEDACLKAIGHVGQHNSPDREGDAKKLVRQTFAGLAQMIESEPQRKYLTYWREAVAKCETTQGYEQWKTEQAAINKWRDAQ